MKDPNLIVRQLIRELREEMSDAARELRNRAAWDLQCPLIVVDARERPMRVLKTSVRGLTGTITTSNVIDDPLIRTFLRRHREIGGEKALAEFERKQHEIRKLSKKAEELRRRAEELREE